MTTIGAQRGMAKFGLVLLWSVLVSMFIGGGWWSPLQAEAATATYYLQGDTTTSLGFDGTANLPTTQTTGTTIPYRGTMVSTPASATSWRPASLTAGSKVLLRGYAPASSFARDITSITSSYYIRTQTNTDTWTFHAYDYDPATGGKTLFGTSSTITGVTAATNTTVTPTYTISGGTYQLPANHRVMVEIVSNPSATSTNHRVYYGGTAATNGSWIIVNETLVGAPTVQWTAASQSGAETGTMAVTAQLSATSAVDVTVPFTVTGTATNGTDYTITPTPITIPAGSTTAAVTITLTEETIYESDETVIVTMGSPTNANIGATTVHTATITNDDPYPTVSWSSASSASVYENGTLVVLAQLSNPTTVNVTVPYTISGPATSGIDYTVTASPLTITAGSTTATATITVLDDALDEADETVILTIGAPTNADPGATTVHTATITDDDDAFSTGVLYQTPWTILGTGTTGTFPAMSLAKGAGTNRLLVIQVVGDYSAATTTFQPTVTYGGQTLTRITSTDTSSRQKVWVGYLNEAGIAAATGTPPAITVTWGTAPQTGCGLSAAFYSRVSQAAPITGSRAVSSDTAATTPTSSPFNVTSGGYGIYGLNTNGTTAGTVNPAAGYYQPFSTANGTLYQHTVGAGFMASSGTTDPRPTWTSVRYAYLAATLQPDTVNNFTVAGTATVAAAGKDKIQVTAPYSADADADNTLLVEYKLTTDGTYTTWQNMTHSSSPYSTLITGLSWGTSYDVRITYQDPDSVNGTAVQVYTVVTRAGGGVESAQVWTNVINDATTRATGTAANLSGNFAVTAPPGTNRMLVVAITHHNTANVAPAAPSTIQYGGVTLKLATTNRATSARVHTWLYYMKDDGIIMDGTDRQVAVSWSGGIASTKIDVYCNVFTGVDQNTTIFTGTGLSNTSNTNAIALSAAMTIPANGLAIYVAEAVNGTNATIPTWTTNANWNTPVSDVAPTVFTGTAGIYGFAHHMAQRAIPSNVTTDNAINSLKSIASRYAISAMVLPPLSVTLANGNNPAGANVYAGDTNVPVDSFALNGSGTVTNIRIAGNANTTSANISAVKIYRKGDSNSDLYTPGVDVLVGSGSFGAVGTDPIDIAVNELITAETDYIIVYDITSTALASGSSIQFTGKVTSITPAAGSLSDAGSTLILMPTTTVGNGTNPAAARLWKSSAATNINAFTLQHNGVVTTDDDTISNISVTLSPQYISGGSGGTVSKFKLVEIVDTTGNTVYGSMNLPTTGDIWNIPVTGVVVTPTLTTYYVRVSTSDVITPSVADTSGTPAGYYSPIRALVTSLIHSKGSNRLVLSDSTSADLTIDMEKPNGPATATATTGSNPGEINLVWDPVSDSNGGSLHPLTPVVIRRSVGDGTSPDPGCSSTTDGSVDLSTVPGVTINYASRTVTDNGLISDNPTRYYYRVCAKDFLGNISDGAQTYANAMVQNDCNNPPSVTLAYEDGSTTAGMQIIKSNISPPFKLQIANNDIGTCPNVTFSVALADVVGNDAHFSKTIDGTEFPGQITLGTGGAGASTGRTVNIVVTGLEATGVQQLEQYKFGVTVTSPGDNHGTPITTPQVTGLLNDMPPIVHNSANMAKYQYGSWGQTYTCATCHSNSTTNIKGVYQLISTPIGRRNVVFTKTSSVDSDSAGVFSNDLRPNKDGSNQVCSICHHQTRQHQYSASKAFGGPAGDEAYNSEHHNSRDCVKCHTHNTAFRSIYGLCGDCHGFKATGYSPVNKSTMVKDLTNALGPNPPNYGAHARHNRALISCGACHSNTNHGLLTTAWSGDQLLEIGFNTNQDTFFGFNPAVPVVGGTFYGTNNLNQPFAWVPGPFTNISTIADYNNSCSTYCHGGGTWKAGGNVGSNTAPIWVGTAQVACGTCHNATGLIPPQSGSHIKHASSTGGGLGIACGSCHSTYSNYTGSAHINGKVEWGLASFPAGAYNGSNSGSTAQPAPTTTGNYATCTNLYCHSNVQGPTGTGSPTTYASHTWGGSAACGTCHVMPNTTGSHASHENAEVSFDCHVCHNNGGTTSPLNHANSIIDFQFVGLGFNTVYSRGNSVAPGTPYGTCSSSDCHGRYTRAWGTPPSALQMCEKCHGSATSPGGFYNTRGPTGTLSVYSSGVGVHDIHVQNLNSPRKSTFARYTSFAAGFSCKQCHTMPSGPFTAGHIDTALPAEIPFNNVSSIANKGILFGYYSTPTYSYVTQTCSAIYCHGAGLHSNRATDEYAGTTPPVRTNPKWNTPYLTGNGGTDCTKCHALPPAAPDSSYAHFGKTLASCSSCHTHVSANGYGFVDKSQHVNGKVDGGCDGCHGSPPITSDIGTTDGLATPPQNALATGPGAHAIHTTIPAIGNLCSTCHSNADPSMAETRPVKELEIGFNAFGGLMTTGTFTGYTNSVNGPKWKASGAGTTLVKSHVQAAVCSNVYCHGGGSTSPVRPVLGGGSNIVADWEGTIVCGDCHGIDSANAPSGGSHPRHALTVASLSCESCHGVTNDNGTHVNGAVSWKIDRNNPGFGPTATYNNTTSGSLSGLAPRGISSAGDDYRTCNNIYCHSNVQGATGTGAPTSYASPRWGNNGSLNCGSCHKDMANDASPTGSHLKHANPSAGMNVPCGYCHQDAGSGFYTMHADGSVFINFTSYIGGSYSNGTPFNGGMQKQSGSGAYGTCSATFCHGTADSPAWGAAGPLACNSCHSAKVDDVSWSGNHKIHYNYSTMPTSYNQVVTDLSSSDKYRFNCAHCHDDNVAKHSLKPASADSAARVFFGISSAAPATSSKRGTYVYGTPQGSTDNGFKFTNGNCNGSYCHSNGRGGNPFNTTLTWTTPKSGSNCTFCHDTKSTTATVSQLSGKHDKHMNPTNNAMIGTGNGFNCVDCHAPTIANINNTTIADKGKHVNAVLNYSGARALKRNYSLGSGSCSTYCHSNGNPSAVVFVSMTGSKLWTGSATITTCNKCHGRGNSTGYPDYANGGGNSATSNLHAGHMNGLTSTTDCADCHRKTAETGVPNRFRPYSTLHLSGGPNVIFNKTKSYIGNNANVNTVGFQVTCSNIVCHGSAAPVWGAQKAGSGGAGVRTCTKCHGTTTTADYLTNYSSAMIAPGYNGEGTDTTQANSAPTSPRVGAHQRHMLGSAISAPVKCGECHMVVTNVRSGNHWNYSTATLTFSGRATTNGHVPSVTRTNGIISCSTTNCHSGVSDSGTTMVPFWNMTGLVKETGTTVGECIKCHAMPPTGAAYANHPGSLNNSASISTVYASCGSCHNNLSSSATSVSNAFADKSIHINGVVNYSMACNSCHDYDTLGGTWGTVKNTNYGGTPTAEGRGGNAHYKHIEYLKARYTVTLNAASDTYGAGAMATVCGACHSINAGDHTTGTPTNPRTINFGDAAGRAARKFGPSDPLYNGNSGTSSSVNPKSCSNLDCHYKTSPIWSTY